jgi:Cellulase (glycosyl hydrolase family 5)
MSLLNAPLSSSGPAILDSGGGPVRPAGVNWGGAHQDNLVPSGLDKLPRAEIASRIVDMGLNHVRFTPSWGDGNAKTDFRLLYADTIPVFHAAGGNKLYFCEGLNYAGDLTKAGAHRVGIAGTVYSLHDYSWYHPAGQSQAAYSSQMDTNGGYIQASGQAPLWIGEFGTDLGTRSNMTSGWMANFLAWATARQVHWCWWELSALAQMGTEPTTGVVKANDGDRESYGMMQGQDWDGSQTEMLTLLQPIM